MECPIVMLFSVFTIELVYLHMYMAIQPNVYQLKLKFVVTKHATIMPYVVLLYCCVINQSSVDSK